ncbi:hypothetical protein JTE90_028169 [Oedothorax gibbosus]|uniref:CRAL-TRIO domain-containing protein n=1 Tax=Oedothorax gibbosus TaxID=931172 RepID=A0AAV6V9A2_9ARAC|nr:hypothetical protein JTE90_028169 [Oedothorax gibbosus]
MSSEVQMYPFIMDHLPEEYCLVAQVQLKETPEKRTKFIDELATMAKANKILSGIDFHPDFLLQFLRVSKFNIEVAFARLYKFIYFRKKNPSFFKGVEDSKMNSSPSYRVVSPLPYRNPEGCAISIIKLGQWDSNEMTYKELISIVYMVLQQALRDPMTQINGIKLIIDFENVTYSYLKFCTPKHLYQIVQLFLECSPSRFKQFHCVNGNMVMKMGWAVLQSFMSEKLKKRVFFHDQMHDLLCFIPKRNLPKEYGGVIEEPYLEEWLKEANIQMNMCTISGQPNFY